MPLEREFQYYLEHQPDFVKQQAGKVIVIKNQTVIGVYDSEVDAVHSTSRTHEIGTFLVQKCEPGTEAYTQTFHSIVTNRC